MLEEARTNQEAVMDEMRRRYPNLDITVIHPTFQEKENGQKVPHPSRDVAKNLLRTSARAPVEHANRHFKAFGVWQRKIHTVMFPVIGHILSVTIAMSNFIKQRHDAAGGIDSAGSDGSEESE